MIRTITWLAPVWIALWAHAASAQPVLPPVLRQVGFDQRLNAQIPLDLAFNDEAGQRVKLGDYFSGKPVILVLAYYRCPMLCTEVLNGLVQAMLDIPFNAGQDFNVVTVSFDPRETPELAAAKKKTYLERYGRPGAAEGWHFLTGEKRSILRLTEAVGFRYTYDAKHDQFAHASGIMVLTPKGRIARYFYGIRYSPRDLRLGLVEASANKIGSPVDQILLFCFHYDPAEGKYGAAVMNFIRVGGVLTVLALATLIAVLWREERRRARRHLAAGFPPAAGRTDPLQNSTLMPAILAEVAFYPEQASTTARNVDTFFFFLVSICGAVGLLVAFLLIYFAIRYRRRPGQTGPPPLTHDSHALEWFWTVTPLGIFMVIFVWGATIYFGAYRAPDDATTIYVVGKQWMWKIQHPEGQREINQLHVPVDQPFKLVMTSEDVIHSFFVPAFRVHMDVLPDRYTSVWFQATRSGTYHLFCSQYCGTNHAGMIGDVIVMEPAEYQNWLHLHAEGSLALEGRKIFLKYRCLSCHSADERARAPVLEELYGKVVYYHLPGEIGPTQNWRTVIADEGYIRESILDPSAKIVAGFENIMPTFKGQVGEEEIVKLIAFMKSLRRGQTPKRVEEFAPPITTPSINPQK